MSACTDCLKMEALVDKYQHMPGWQFNTRKCYKHWQEDIAEGRA